MKRKIPGGLNHQTATATVTTSNGSRRQHGEARRKLPVYKYRAEICNLVAENDAVLVIAETVSHSSLLRPQNHGLLLIYIYIFIFVRLCFFKREVENQPKYPPTCRNRPVCVVVSNTRNRANDMPKAFVSLNHVEWLP